MWGVCQIEGHARVIRFQHCDDDTDCLCLVHSYLAGNRTSAGSWSNLQILAAAGGAAIDRHHACPVEYVGVQTTGAALSKVPDELPDAIFRH